MKVFRHILSFAIIAAFVLSSALSHAHPVSHDMAADTGHQMMQHAMGTDHAHHHGDTSGNALQPDDAPHCCSMGPCGFLAPTSPYLSQSGLSVISLEMTGSLRISVETTPEAPPPRTVA